MAEIVNLTEFKIKNYEQKVYGFWKKRFNENFSLETGIEDISDQTLLYLAQPGEQSTTALYEIIMGALDLGHAAKFSYLKMDDQRFVMEIQLFLSDLCRFEMMRRLGWIKPVTFCKKNLVGLVKGFEDHKEFCLETPPELSETHPDYYYYKSLHERDREGFIRRLLPGALDIFRRKLNS